MPAYTHYTDEQLIELLEHKADYKPAAIEAALEEWARRNVKPKRARTIAGKIVRHHIRRFLRTKHRLTFNHRKMILPESHFLSEKAVSKIFGEEYKAWKERKKLFEGGSGNDYLYL